MRGQTIGHYRILEQIGLGGMGVVYKAEDTRLRRVVALKFLPESLRGDAKAREQFLREARAASQIKHPNVLTIYTVEESSEGDFIAMEFAESGTLRERVGSISMLQSIEFMGQAASGLQEAHQHGIIHRDIKPDNLLIDGGGRLRVSDFGLARMSWDSSAAMQSNVAVGTAHYMSPEQVTGAEVDARSDIFALGVTFFEVIARRRPFEGDYVMSVLYSIANDAAPRITEFDPSVPEELDRIIARCLAKHVDDRYQTCAELINDLERLLGRDARVSESRKFSHLLAEQSSKPKPTTPFIGRRNELATITEKFRSAINGAGHTVFLVGESGVGKSRLAESAIEAGRELGMGVLAGRCLPQGGGLPFHAYTSALRNGIPRLNEALAGSLERRADALGIEMHNRLPIIKSFLNMSGAGAVVNQEQLWGSLLALLRVISAERPVILFLDDLQWADDDTLRFFAYVARSAMELPIVQIATLRTTAGDDVHAVGGLTVSGLVRQLHGDGYADLIEVERLSSSETLDLAARLLEKPVLDTALAEAITRRTDGNPLFVHEIVQLIRQSGDDATSAMAVPHRVRDIVAQRVERLGASDRELLEFAACETEYFDSEILAECLRIERIPLLKSLQRLETSHRLIRHDGTRYRFDHPLVREVVYEGVLPELRVEFHRMLAASLSARHQDTSESASRVAHHLLASGQAERAIPHLLRAAERARDLCANSEALRLYASVESIAGWSATQDSATRVKFLLGYGDVLLAKGRIEEAQDRYAAAMKIVEPSNDQTTAIDIQTRLSTPYRMRGALDLATKNAREASEQARTLGDRKRLSDALTALAMINVTRSEYGQAIAHAGEVYDLATQSGDTHRQSESLAMIGAAYLHSGQYDQSAEHLNRAIDIQRSLGDQKGLASSLNFSGLAHHRLASFTRSIQQHHESLRIKRAIQENSAIPGSLNALGDVYRDIGQLELALQNHSESLTMARQHANRGAECDNLRDLGVDYLLLGRPEESEQSLREVLRLASEHKYPWYETRALSTLSELYVHLRNPDRAEEPSSRALEMAGSIGAIELLAEAQLARARVLAARGEGIREATELLKSSISLAESGSLKLPLRTLYWMLAELLRRANRLDDAHAAQRAARRLLSEAAESINDQAMREQFMRTPLSLAILADQP